MTDASLINPSSTITGIQLTNTTTPRPTLSNLETKFDAYPPYSDYGGEATGMILWEQQNDFVGVSPYQETDYYYVGPELDLELCGYPVFMDSQDCDSNSSISSCINYGKATVFGMVITILGVSIIAVNVLISALVVINKSLRSHYYYVKASLAVADAIVGFLLIFSVLPNLVWASHVTKEDLVFFPAEDKNSARAVTMGALLTVSLTASLLHLAFLSFERFIAIKWPFRHMRRKTRSVIVTCACLWAISLVASLVPVAFPEYFAYQFQPTILIHTMTMQQVNGTISEWRGILYGTVTIILPYVIMTVFCVMTAINTYRKMRKSRTTFRRENKTHRANKMDPDIFVFVTVGMMIAAFTLTFLPFTVVMILFVTDVLDCENYTVPYVLLFYVGMLNGLTNGIIYSVRDQRFRQAVKDMFRCSKSTHKKGVIVTQSQLLSPQKH